MIPDPDPINVIMPAWIALIMWLILFGPHHF
jgi:hypothetical protein